MIPFEPAILRRSTRPGRLGDPGSSGASVARLGVFGGAFNPPHLGHFALADEALFQLRLDRVLMVPTGRAGHKLLRSDPGGEKRLEMLAAGLGGCERLVADPIEVETARHTASPSFTHLTLETLARREPTAELVVILGSDAASRFGDWRDPERVSSLASVAVAARDGADLTAALAELGRFWPLESIQKIEMRALALSSTEVRERVASGRPYRFWVGDAVSDVIVQRRIYR